VRTSEQEKQTVLGQRCPKQKIDILTLHLDGCAEMRSADGWCHFEVKCVLSFSSGNRGLANPSVAEKDDFELQRRHFCEPFKYCELLRKTTILIITGLKILKSFVP
jgi:hypothetical protein